MSLIGTHNVPYSNPNQDVSSPKALYLSLVTPSECWSTFKKLIVAKLGKKFPASYGSRRFIMVLANPITGPYPKSAESNLRRHISHMTSSFRLPHKNYTRNSHLSHACYILTKCIILGTDASSIFLANLPYITVL